MSVFVLPILLLFFVLPLVVVLVLASSALQPAPQRVVRRPEPGRTGPRRRP
jgi:hypothetical protein